MKLLNQKNACAYIRVSTDKQEELSPDAQKRLIIDYCKKNGLNILNEYIFTENGISGKKADKRPEFQKMIGMAKSKDHPFDVILVWKFSRFARNQEESIVYKAMLQKAHVEVVSVSEPIIDGPFGSLIERIIEWMDEYYSIRLSGEVIRGMTEKALRGGYQARPPVGYVMNKHTGIPEIYEPEAKYIRMIFNDFLAGSSYIEIARKYNALGLKTKRGNGWEQRSIKYMLENPFYYGMVRWNRQNHEEHTVKDKSEWIISPGNHEAIIPEEQFNQVQEQIALISRPYKSRGTMGIKHWLSGVVKCSTCGASLVSNTLWKGHSASFQCGKYVKALCTDSHYVKTERLEQGIYDAFLHFSDADLNNLEIIHTSETKPDINLDLMMIKLDDKEKRIKQAYRDGIDTLEEYKDNKAILNKEREQLEELKKSYEQDTSSDDDIYAFKKRLKNAYEVISNTELDTLTRANAIRSVVDHAVFDKSNDSLDIFFKFVKS